MGAFLLLVVLLLLLCMLLSVPTRLGRGKPVQITRLRGPNKIVYRSPEPILGEFGSGFCDKSVRSLKSGVFPVSLCVLFVNILTYLLTYLITYLLTHSLTPWSRVLLEKPTCSQLVKKIHLNIILQSPSSIFPSGLPTKTLYTLLPSTTRATCSTHLILLDFITRTI